MTAVKIQDEQAVADDKFACLRSASIDEMRSDKVILRAPAISLSPFQKASSKLMLVL